MESIILPTIKQATMIAAFVLIMMVVIEYINVQSRNYWSQRLKQSPLIQIVLAALLGVIPGCLGAFTVVSLYTHRMIGFAGLVATMIATSGDAAFAMFALFPKQALILNVILFSVAIVVGLLVHYIVGSKPLQPSVGFVVHDEDYCKGFSSIKMVSRINDLSFERSVFLLSTILFITFLATGIVGPEGWGWIKITFLIGSLFMLFIFATAPQHFLVDHIYKHIIRKHSLKIFLWTWGAYIALYFIQADLSISTLVQEQQLIVLSITSLIGIIPDSGPHMLLVTMFSEGLLPFSILIANSIIQDGHGMLPLLAESRKTFIIVKGINLLVGFLIGLILLLLNI